MGQCAVVVEAVGGKLGGNRFMSGRGVGEEVVEACRRGDREAFRLLFEAYKDRVYSIALYYFNGDEASARDASQQVFLKLLTGMNSFRGRAEFSTWLYRLVANVCIDRHRSGRALVFLDDLASRRELVERTSPEEDHLRRQVEQSVQAEVARLRPKLRLPILLRYFEGLSYQEIAQVMNCSAGTVASRLNRGHKMLATKLAHLRGVLVRGG